MHTHFRWLAFAVLIAAFSAGTARADIIGTANFTISGIVGGPCAGDTFTGTFTYDATVAQTVWTPLLSFTTNLPSWAGATLTDPGIGQDIFNSTGGLNIFFAPGPIGNTNAFTLFNSSFIYGTTQTVGQAFLDAGSGTFAFTTSVPAPESSTLSLLSCGLFGLGFLVAMKRCLRIAGVNQA